MPTRYATASRRDMKQEGQRVRLASDARCSTSVSEYTISRELSGRSLAIPCIHRDTPELLDAIATRWEERQQDWRNSLPGFLRTSLLIILVKLGSIVVGPAGSSQPLNNLVLPLVPYRLILGPGLTSFKSPGVEADTSIEYVLRTFLTSAACTETCHLVYAPRAQAGQEIEDPTHPRPAHDLDLLADPDDQAEFFSKRMIVIGVLDANVAERRALRLEVGGELGEVARPRRGQCQRIRLVGLKGSSALRHGHSVRTHLVIQQQPGRVVLVVPDLFVRCAKSVSHRDMVRSLRDRSAWLIDSPSAILGSLTSAILSRLI